MSYLPMNVNLPPFNNEKARQAVAFAIDRRAIVNMMGGPRLALPSCQILPPGMAGYQPYCPYTKDPGATWTAPDLERAKTLVEESGTKGQKITLITGDGSTARNIGTYLQSLLSQLGYDARVKAISNNIEFTYIQGRGLPRTVGFPQRAVQLRQLPAKLRFICQYIRLLRPSARCQNAERHERQ
jgi:peptide/nickel transport system substrate-binding protein